MMYRRIMLACSLWLVWWVPSSAKYRGAVNWASMRFDQDEFVGVQAISALLAAAIWIGTGSVSGGGASWLAADVAESLTRRARRSG
jgi:hypothetical protein